MEKSIIEGCKSVDLTEESRKMGLYSVFSGKTVMVTGHTGFKGSWFSVWLTILGARVVGISNDLPSEPCNFSVSNLFNFL